MVDTSSIDNITLQNIELIIPQLHVSLDVYKFSSIINNLFKKSFSSENAEFITKTLKVLSKLDFSSSNDYVYFHFYDAFYFLLTTSNVKVCLEIYAEFLKRKHHPCEKSFTKIIEYALKEGLFEEISKILDDVFDINNLNPNGLKELFNNLKIANRCDLASKIILNIPLDNPSINYIWDFYISGFSKNNEQIIKNTLKTVMKLNVPEKQNKIEEIYDIFLAFLLKNNEKSDFIFEVLSDLMECELKVSGQNIRNFFLNCLEEDYEFGKLFNNLKTYITFLDSYSVGLMLKKLIQRQRKLEIVRFMDFFINNSSTNIKFSDISLTPNEFKYIIILQNQLSNFKDKSVKEGEILSELAIIENSDFSILDSFSNENF